METVVAINNLSVTLGGRFKALKDVSVELPARKIIGCIGPSGAGKTTLIRTLTGRQVITQGSASILGLPAGSPKLRPEIGYMPQEAAAYSDLTVRQNLRYFAKMKNQSVSAAESVIKETGLEKQTNQLVSTLSGGQKSRVSLAIALLGRPKLLLLDEPTVGVDPVLRRQLWQLFRKLAGEGATLVVSSHVMDEASRCDQLLLIREGELLAYGTPDELKKRTATHSVEESFLALVEGRK